MSGKTRRIENEEQYQKSLAWLIVEGKRLDEVEDIHDPLLKPAEKAKLLRRYNIVDAELRRYLMTEIAQDFPYMKRMYEEAGLLKIEQAQELPNEPEPAAVDQPEPEQPKPAVNAASWLDD